MAKIKISLTIIVILFTYNMNAQNVTIKIKSVKITHKSDFKGRNSNKNGKYITGQFEIVNKSNEALIVPIMSDLDRWTNNFSNRLYFKGIENPFFLMKIVEKKLSENSTVLKGNSKLVDNSYTKAETNEKISFITGSGSKTIVGLSSNYSTQIIKPNTKKTFYFSKKKKNSNLGLDIFLVYNTFVLNKKLLQKELKKEKRKLKKAKKKYKKKLKALNKIISKYATISVHGNRTSYVIKHKSNINKKNKFEKALKNRAKFINYSSIKSVIFSSRQRVEYLKNLIKITPLKLMSEIHI